MFSLSNTMQARRAIISQEKVYFFFDESGKTGYANSNCNTGDFGLIAGIATPERNVAGLELKLEIIFNEINSQGLKKMHATEIFTGGMNSEIREYKSNAT